MSKNKQRSAIITGVTGQVGSYLTEFLLEKDYKVYGLKRRTSNNSYGNINHLLNEKNFEIVEGDLSDLSSITSVCKTTSPDEFYNLAAQSEVGTSFSQPFLTLESTGLGVLNCLEAIKQTNKNIKFFQASTSEMFGGLSNGKAYNESSPLHPRSPYGCAKAYAHYTTINYRESYNIFACIGIMFNNESSRRGPYFVTQKIATAAAKIFLKKQDYLYLGNLNSFRDWSYSGDIVRGIYLIMQHKTPEEFVLSSDETHSIEEFCNLAFSYFNLNYKDYVKIDPKFYRPAEVHILKGDSSKARNLLNWKPECSFEKLVQDMVESALQKEKNE
jgi:GDPmannose 4,6-dehydratase